jgi:hypothetical protein
MKSVGMCWVGLRLPDSSTVTLMRGRRRGGAEVLLGRWCGSENARLSRYLTNAKHTNPSTLSLLLKPSYHDINEPSTFSS